MKKIVLFAVLLISANSSFRAQQQVMSIQNNQTSLVINDSIIIQVGKKIQINLPAGKDFIFVKQKKSGISSKLIGSVAEIAGSTASAVGISASTPKILQQTTKVLNSANSIKYGVHALEKIKDLPISNEAKKIAGKEMEVLSWEFREDGYFVITKFEKKKYEIYLQEAVYSGEIKLNK